MSRLPEVFVVIESKIISLFTHYMSLPSFLSLILFPIFFAMLCRSSHDARGDIKHGADRGNKNIIIAY